MHENVKEPEWQHSKECMCLLQNQAMNDNQESVTTGQTDTHAQTDAWQSGPSSPSRSVVPLVA